MQYLQQQKKNTKAHIWNQEKKDTACKMWSTGGLKKDKDWQITESSIKETCTMCQNNFNQN